VHHHSSHQNTSDIRVAFFLNLGFAIFEVVGGLLTNSIAILSDALHDAGDTLSLGLALLLNRQSEKGSDQRYTYGYGRFSLLSAQITSLVLIAGALYVIYESVIRIQNPEPFDERGMIAIAVVGIVVNGVAVLRLRRDEGLNVNAVGWHLMQDVLGWAAVLVVGIISLFVDLPILDPLLSLLISLYIMVPAFKNLRKATQLLLQAVPSELDLSDLQQRLLSVSQVTGLRNLHLWSLDGERHVLITRLVVDSNTPSEDYHRIKSNARQAVEDLNFEYLTIEIEVMDASQSTISLNAPDHGHASDRPTEQEK
jgi:cobalt-zinc-cadmium efflux system protein